jgi:hypothetical protein
MLKGVRSRSLEPKEMYFVKQGGGPAELIEGGSHASASTYRATCKRRKQASRLGTPAASNSSNDGGSDISNGGDWDSSGKAEPCAPEPNVCPKCGRARNQGLEVMANFQTPMPCPSTGCSDVWWKYAGVFSWCG